jgi:hypothetical protein
MGSGSMSDDMTDVINLNYGALILLVGLRLELPHV